MNIREAGKEDKDAILSLLDELLNCVVAKGGHPSPSTNNRDTQGKLFDELLQRNDVKIFVVEENGKIVGVADVFIVPLMRRGYYQAKIEDLVVTEKMRGKGVGSKLFNYIIEYCKV
jgi:N-acetylglutamate synthase-like GNAT family acetyltransferase